jgi:hypothetical protein
MASKTDPEARIKATVITLMIFFIFFFSLLPVYNPLSMPPVPAPVPGPASITGLSLARGPGPMTGLSLESTPVLLIGVLIAPTLGSLTGPLALPESAGGAGEPKSMVIFGSQVALGTGADTPDKLPVVPPFCAGLSASHPAAGVLAASPTVVQKARTPLASRSVVLFFIVTPLLVFKSSPITLTLPISVRNRQNPAFRSRKILVWDTPLAMTRPEDGGGYL